MRISHCHKGKGNINPELLAVRKQLRGMGSGMKWTDWNIIAYVGTGAIVLASTKGGQPELNPLHRKKQSNVTIGYNIAENLFRKTTDPGKHQETCQLPTRYINGKEKR